MESTAKSLKVGQLATLCGKSVRAIRFYEELGLLQPSARTSGGFRLYTPDAAVRIKWIDRLQELGFSLTDIQDFLATLEGEESGPDQMARLERFYRVKLAETRQAIERMRLLETELTESIEYLQGCNSCAPATPRGTCASCNQPVHEGTLAPDMVAAVTNH